MSKIGRRSIAIPEGAEISLTGGKILVSGPKGKLEMSLHPKVAVKIEDKTIKVSVDDAKDREKRAMWGTTRSLIAGMIVGVTAGFEKKLEVIGVGYRVAVEKDKLTMQLGYSHPVELTIPKGIEAAVKKNEITLNGISKQAVGQFAALIRGKRPPEPYKGKGIKYSDEVVRRKAGKVMKSAGA